MNRNSPWSERRKVVLPAVCLFGMTLGAVIYFLPDVIVARAKTGADFFLMEGQERGERNIIRIVEDRGGPVLARMEQISALERSSYEIQVVGICASACTFYLGQPDVCTMPNAGWMFHPIQSETWIPRSIDPFIARLSAMLPTYYPAGLQGWIREMNEEMDPEQAFWLTGQALSDAGWIRLCSDMPVSPEVEVLIDKMNEGVHLPSPLPGSRV